MNDIGFAYSKLKRIMPDIITKPLQQLLSHGQVHAYYYLVKCVSQCYKETKKIVDSEPSETPLDSFNIFYQNIYGWSSNIDLVNQLLSTKTYDVLAVLETHTV